MKTEPLNMRISPELKKWVEKEADREGRSMSNFVTMILKRIKEERGKKN
jgi:uncharacterized protein (DUF1778 family)